MIERKCSCEMGMHRAPLERYIIESGAVNRLPELLKDYNKVYMVCDENTYRVLGERAEQILKSVGKFSHKHILKGDVLPDARNIGDVLIHLNNPKADSDIFKYSPQPDFILAVGSGVVNDICRVVSYRLGLPYGIAGTAPSMDGFASNSASMEVNNVKLTLYNASPAFILLDTEILAQAPERMLWAGLGDMAAKYCSICEWRISHLVTGEYYCEEVAKLVRRSLKKCVDAAAGLPNRDSAAVGAIAEGLILSGMAMGFAEVSRPASGLEHYFSHMWEMMALERGHKSDLHGIQVGVGTKLTMQIYQKILRLTPDRARAMAVTENFDAAAWEAQVRRIFGKTAPQILKIEEKTHKNDPQKHAARVEKLIGHWDEVLSIIREELPSYDFIIGVMRAAGLPMTPAGIGVSLADTKDALLGARDIRDKYLSCSMLWDLGYLNDFVQAIEMEANQI